MADRAPVELVRVPQQEKLYEREAILGRDTTSVFPSEGVQQGFESQQSKDALGTGKFVTEAQLEEARQQGNSGLSNDAELPLRPLVEILKEAKEKKEEDFQAQWRQMKQGKNRPLDEDELEFLDRVRSQQRAKERLEREEDAAELDAYQLAVREAAERREAAARASAQSTELTQELPEAPDQSAAVSAHRYQAVQTKRRLHTPAVILKKGSLHSVVQSQPNQAVQTSQAGAGEPLANLLQQYSSGSSTNDD
ncbi:hypothetical protein WJX74_003583 [Apatococcus lobatus]|uniref:FAM192A/Fyv6 N-terminal domain-containing protein n=2 Tax=Apatococcus TaxID=904362 RepID=A0AAW1RJ02_9CHLO